MIQIVSTKEFVNRITVNKLSPEQIARVCAYLRVNKLSFYDDWSKRHVSILLDLESNKVKVLEALRNSLNI